MKNNINESWLTSQDLFECKIMKYSDHTIRDWLSDNKKYVQTFRDSDGYIDTEKIPFYIEYDWKHKKFEIIVNDKEFSCCNDDPAIQEFLEYMKLRKISTSAIVEFIKRRFNILNTIISNAGFVLLHITKCEGLNSFHFYYEKGNDLYDMAKLINEFDINIEQVDSAWTAYSYLGASILECPELMELLQPWLKDNAYIKPYTNYRIKLSTTDKQKIYLERDLILSPKKRKCSCV